MIYSPHKQNLHQAILKHQNRGEETGKQDKSFGRIGKYEFRKMHNCKPSLGTPQCVLLRTFFSKQKHTHTHKLQMHWRNGSRLRQWPKISKTVSYECSFSLSFCAKNKKCK